MIRTLSLILLAFRSLRHTSMTQIAPPGMTLMPMVLPSNPVVAIPNSFGITAGTCGILHMGNPPCPNWFCTRGMDIILLSVRECSSDITMPLHSHSLLLSPFRRIADDGTLPNHLVEDDAMEWYAPPPQPASTPPITVDEPPVKTIPSPSFHCTDGSSFELE